jgi:large subunit ribosomal protein L18
MKEKLSKQSLVRKQKHNIIIFIRTMIANRIERRKRRIRAKINGTKERPRISVYRSHKYIYAQAIDDEAKQTLGAYTSMKVADAESKTKSEEAKQVGTELAAILKKKKISHAVYDRGQYAYNGRVKELAEGIREGGITM